MTVGILGPKKVMSNSHSGNAYSHWGEILLSSRLLSTGINIVTYRLTARSSEREETVVASERLDKHVPEATDTHATIEKLLEAVFEKGVVGRIFGRNRGKCGGWAGHVACTG
jgi:hypothetical protein